MEKYELLPQQLLLEGTCDEANFFEPELPNDKYICAVHDPDYYYDFLNLKLSQKEIRRTGGAAGVGRQIDDRERTL